MYEKGEIDGTNTTYVCHGQVIHVDKLEDRPPFTIVDGGPPKHQYVHQRTTFPPMGPDSFHNVSMAMLEYSMTNTLTGQRTNVIRSLGAYLCHS